MARKPRTASASPSGGTSSVRYAKLSPAREGLLHHVLRGIAGDRLTETTHDLLQFIRRHGGGFPERRANGKGRADYLPASSAPFDKRACFSRAA